MALQKVCEMESMTTAMPARARASRPQPHRDRTAGLPFPKSVHGRDSRPRGPCHVHVRSQCGRLARASSPVAGWSRRRLRSQRRSRRRLRASRSDVPSTVQDTETRHRVLATNFLDGPLGRFQSRSSASSSISSTRGSVLRPTVASLGSKHSADTAVAEGFEKKGRITAESRTNRLVLMR